MTSARPNTLILRAPGTNCDEETANAFELAGAKTERIHILRILENPALLGEYQILCIPGGFSFGDDIASGRILANSVKHHLLDAFQEFRNAGKLILGICNGFQVLIKSGLLIPDDTNGPLVSLCNNDSGRFTCRWTKLHVGESPCVFLRGIEKLDLPIAHAEGRFQTRCDSVFASLNKNGQLPLRFFDEFNFSGTQGSVAGVCDETGRVFGMMPHPERHISSLQHPNWTRCKAVPHSEFGDGLRIFQNAVAFFS